MARFLVILAALAVSISGLPLRTTWLAQALRSEVGCCEEGACCCSAELEACCTGDSVAKPGVIVTGACGCGGHDDDQLHAFGPRQFLPLLKEVRLKLAERCEASAPCGVIVSLDRAAPRPPPPRS